MTDPAEQRLSLLDQPEAAEPRSPANTAQSGEDTVDTQAAHLPRRLIHPASLVVAAVVGAAMALAFDTGPAFALTSVAVLQGLLIGSWIVSAALVGRIGAIVVAVAAAVAADILVTRRPHGELGALIAVVGLAVVTMFGHQLLRGRRRSSVVESLSGIALLVVLTIAPAALIQLRHQVDGATMATAVVLCISAALVAGHLVDWLWSPLRFDQSVSRGLPGVLASVVAGGAVTMARLHNSVEFPGQRALLLGAALAVVTALFAVGAAFVRAAVDEAVAAGAPDGPDVAAPGVRRVALGRIARALADPLFVIAFCSPIAYLLCLALRG
jgi:hypothetical protein